MITLIELVGLDTILFLSGSFLQNTWLNTRIKFELNFGHFQSLRLCGAVIRISVICLQERIVSPTQKLVCP